MEDMVKTWGPFAVAALTAWLAWMYRRQERRDDAYAAWAGAIHKYVGAALTRQESEKNAERRYQAFSELLAARARVLLLEKCGELRASVNLLSDVSELGADAPERAVPVPALPPGMWPTQFFFERKMLRVDIFVADLADAGWLERWNVKPKEPKFEKLPPRRELPATGSPIKG